MQIRQKRTVTNGFAPCALQGKGHTQNKYLGANCVQRCRVTLSKSSIGCGLSVLFLGGLGNLFFQLLLPISLNLCLPFCLRHALRFVSIYLTWVFQLQFPISSSGIRGIVVFIFVIVVVVARIIFPFLAVERLITCLSEV